MEVEVPEAALRSAAIPPKSDGSGQDRRLLLKAGGLLDDAGWRIENVLGFDGRLRIPYYPSQGLMTQCFCLVH